MGKEVGQEATFKLVLKDGVESRKESGRKVFQMAGGMCEEARGRKKIKGSNVTSESRVLGSVPSLGSKGLATVKVFTTMVAVLSSKASGAPAYAGRQLKGQSGQAAALLSPGELFPESSTWKLTTFFGCPR